MLWIRISDPAVQVRLEGEGTALVLAQLRQLYPTLVIYEQDQPPSDQADAEEWIAITQSEWYQGRASQMTPGRRLRVYRDNAGLTLTRLASLSGMDKRLISQIEHDGRALSEPEARQLAQCLDCDHRSLL